MKLISGMLAVAGMMSLAIGTAQATDFTVAGSYTYVAPTSGLYSISALGGAGGFSTPIGGGTANGGLGANAFGTFALAAGDQLGIVVGASAGPGSTFGQAGLGSFVYLLSSSALLLAGGGGGGASSITGSNFLSSDGGNASILSSPLTLSGGSVAGVNGTSGFCCGPNSAPGVGGLSYLNSAFGGYGGGGTITLAATRSAGSVSIAAPVSSAVPEPATWALMIMGFAGVGFAMRRRAQHRLAVRYSFA